LNWDGKIPNTLKALFFKPGQLTVDFLAGRRARWLSPLRVYLICSIAFFVSKPVIEASTHRSLREIAGIGVTNPGRTLTITPEMRQEVESGLPGRIFGKERVLRAMENSARFTQGTETVFPRAMFVLLPVFALLTQVAWRRHRWLYPAHLYLALHLHAAWFGALLVLTVALSLFTSDVVSNISLVVITAYIAVYALLALRRVFNEPWPATMLKAACIAVVYSMCVFAMSLLMLGFVVFRM
jgi:hypothetical protein